MFMDAPRNREPETASQGSFWQKRSGSVPPEEREGPAPLTPTDQNVNLAPSWTRRAWFVLFVVVPKTVVLTSARVL